MDAPSSDEDGIGVDEVVRDVVGAVVNETADELLLGAADAVACCTVLTVVDTD